MRSGAVTVVERGDASTAWVAGTELRISDSTTKLGAAANATLIATLAPLAVPTPGGTALAYNSWRGRRPTIRVRTLPEGDESTLDEGAHSPAWGSDGRRVAYFKALTPEFGDPRRYLGHVVVRDPRGAERRRWTARAGRYVVAAWAGDRVVAYRLRTSFPDLIVLDAPRRERVLAAGSALVALSPDGSRVFVSRYGPSPAVVRVLDVASGEELARFRPDPQHAPYVLESGSWEGDRVFAATTTGIAVFRVGEGTIELEQVLRVAPTFPAGVFEPRASADGRTVVAWGELEPQPRQAIPQAALVECDRRSLRCVRVAVSSSSAPPRPVYNPSRP